MLALPPQGLTEIRLISLRPVRLVHDQQVAPKIEFRRCVGVLDHLDRSGREPLHAAGLYAVCPHIQMRSTFCQRNDADAGGACRFAEIRGREVVADHQGRRHQGRMTVGPVSDALMRIIMSSANSRHLLGSDPRLNACGTRHEQQQLTALQASIQNPFAGIRERGTTVAMTAKDAAATFEAAGKAARGFRRAGRS
jgi:hypothetical protein